MDTHSHPGYLMLKLLGPGLGTGFGAAGGSSSRLSDYRPPWEIETSVIAPDDSIPWNYWMNFIVQDKRGKSLGMWTPGVENNPRAKRHRPFPGGSLKVRFARDVPESILSAKPLGILIQCLDDSHVRLGFRGKAGEPWTLSETCDIKQALGAEVGAFAMHCWSTTTGRMYGTARAGRCTRSSWSTTSATAMGSPRRSRTRESRVLSEHREEAGRAPGARRAPFGTPEASRSPFESRDARTVYYFCFRTQSTCFRTPSWARSRSRV